MSYKMHLNRGNRRRYRPFQQAGCAGLVERLTCIHGPSVPHTKCEIMGPAIAPYRPDVERNVANFVVGANADQRRVIVDHIVASGDCILHACAIISGTRCGCAPCSDPSDPRHEWSRSSLSLGLAGQPWQVAS